MLRFFSLGTALFAALQVQQALASGTCNADGAYLLVADAPGCKDGNIMIMDDLAQSDAPKAVQGLCDFNQQIVVLPDGLRPGREVVVCSFKQR